MATIQDLMKLTGKGRQAVTTAIDRGQLPGYRIGPGYIWIPDEALEAVRKGHWRPGGEGSKKSPFLKSISRE